MPKSPKPSDSYRGPTGIDWRKRAEDAEREREALRRGRDRLQREQERLRHQIDHLMSISPQSEERDTRYSLMILGFDAKNTDVKSKNWI